MIIYRTLLCLAAMPALVAVWFFLEGLADGTVSAFNILLWMGLLAAVCGLPAAGMALRASGRMGAAKLVLSVAALPVLLGGVVLVVLIIAPPRWH
jgi:hypothetical protein